MAKIIILLLLPLSSLAQLGKIDTDRPDQTESAFTIPKKYIQIEAGFVAEKQNAYVTQYTAPTVLTKYGITQKTELRLILESVGDDDKVFRTGVQNISTPVQLGLKTSLWESKGLLPKTSIIVHSAFQRIQEDGKKTIQEIAANFRFTCQHSFTKNIALGYNIGMEWESFNEAPAYIYTVAPGIDLTDKFYFYIEAFGNFFKKEAPENSVDAGLAFYATNNLKIDISAGKGISNAAPPYYFGFGVSFRFKTGK